MSHEFSKQLLGYLSCDMYVFSPLVVFVSNVRPCSMFDEDLLRATVSASVMAFGSMVYTRWYYDTVNIKKDCSDFKA